MPLLLATHNLGKVREVQALMGPGAPEIRSLRDFPHLAAVEEDGLTFEANAEKKARAAAAATGWPALADDSGLCVDALGGRPGVLSARYAPGTDADRVQALLTEMASVPDAERGAAFVCVLYLAVPSGPGIAEHGECRGRIARGAAGTGGFGYDPVFFVPDLGKTFAELSQTEKNRYSHRAFAFAKMRPHLLRHRE